jgi:hypothetical protein
MAVSLLGMVMPRFVDAAADIEYRPWRPSVWMLLLVGAALFGLSLGMVLSLGYSRGPVGPYEYHLWRWEADTILANVFSLTGISHEPDKAEGQAAIASYFKLTSEIGAASDAANPDTGLIETLTNERAAYENDVEAVIEQYIDEAVTAAGLQRQLPLFSGVSLTWPPVSFKLTSPPRLLVRSPRDKIAREGDTLLEPGLSLSQAEKIEADTTTKDDVSLVVSIGGLAAYPAIVSDDRSYDSLLNTASHEWTHHYLAFYPLGQQWSKGGDALVLNETTANVSGREIANLIRKAHPTELPAGEDGNAPSQPAPTVDYNAEMRSLRLEVDDLLAKGKVTEAEQAMEDKRQFLAAHGITIRKINQAYFAFYGTYANTAASSNPIGPKIEHVWDLTKDVGLFLRNMREVTNVKDLDATIARLESGKMLP